MMERRLEGRFLCADLVRVDWSARGDRARREGSGSGEAGSGEAGSEGAGSGDEEFRTVEAVLEDISTQGACVQVEERIPLGAAISISASISRQSDPVVSAPDGAGEGARFCGHVSYCAYRDYGYFVGIRFSDETKWSSGVFEPQHLTDLATLQERDGSGLAEEVSPPAL